MSTAYPVAALSQGCPSYSTVTDRAKTEVGQLNPDGKPVKIYQVDIRGRASKAHRDNKSAHVLTERSGMITQTHASMEGGAAAPLEHSHRDPASSCATNPERGRTERCAVAGREVSWRSPSKDALTTRAPVTSVGDLKADRY